MKKIVMVFVAVMLTACSLIGQDELSLNQKKMEGREHYTLPALFIRQLFLFLLPGHAARH